MAICYCDGCCTYFDPDAWEQDIAEYGNDENLCATCVDDRDSNTETFLEACALLGFAVEMSEAGIPLSGGIKSRCEATASEMWQMAKESNTPKHGSSSAKDDSDEVLTSAVQRFKPNWFAKHMRSTGGDV